jgi:hypothetical protein
MFLLGAGVDTPTCNAREIERLDSVAFNLLVVFGGRITAA